MTDDELAAIERRAEAATKGEWRSEHHPSTNGWELHAPIPDLNWNCGTEIHAATKRTMPIAIEPWSRFTPPEYGQLVRDTFAFIAYARTDIPALIAEIRRLREQLDQASTSHDCLMAIRDRLILIGCSCDPKDHDATPPMMYDDWITCAVAKREREIRELRAGKAGG